MRESGLRMQKPTSLILSGSSSEDQNLKESEYQEGQMYLKSNDQSLYKMVKEYSSVQIERHFDEHSKMATYNSEQQQLEVEMYTGAHSDHEENS